MDYIGRTNLKKRVLKNYLLNNNSQTNYNVYPQTTNNTAFNNYMNSNKHNKSYKKINEKRNNYLRHKTYLNNLNDDLITPSHNYVKTESNFDYKLSPNVSQRNRRELLIQKMKNLINQRKMRNENNMVNPRNSQNYSKMMKKNNADFYQNGIDLSISNCETHSPINDINDDDFFDELLFFLENYDKEKTKELRKSYDKSKNGKKNQNIPKVYHRKEIIEQSPNTYRIQKNVENHNNLDDFKINNKINNNKNNLSKNFYKTSVNFRKKNYNTNLREKNYNNELIEFLKNNNTTNNNNNNIDYYRNDFNNTSKLMNMDKKRKENNSKSSKNNKRNSSNEMKQKLRKQYELQEQYISKIEILTRCVENYYIVSLKDLFKYFINKLQLYIKANKSIDTIRLLKRFQKLKSRNAKKNFNSICSSSSINFYSNYNNCNYTTYDRNIIHSIDNYDDNSKLYEDKSTIKKSNNNSKIYIPKNNMEIKIKLKNREKNPINLSNDKNKKNYDLFQCFSNNKRTPYADTDKKMNLSTDYNSKKIFISNTNNKNIKNKNNECNIYHTTDNYSNNKRIEINNNHLGNITSFEKMAKNDSMNKCNSNFNDHKNHSIKKPIVYVKPKPSIRNIKKKIISKEKKAINNNKNNNIKNKSSLYGKTLKNNSGLFFIELKDNKNNLNKDNSLLTNYHVIKSSIKFNIPHKNEKNKTTSNKNINKNKRNEDSIKGLIIKDLSTSDRRIQIRIKYLKSEKYLQILSKMRIIRKIMNVKNNSNIFLFNEFDLLKPSKTDSIVIIPPLTLLNTHILNTNNTFNVILEETGLNNEDTNFNNLLERLFDIMEQYEKRIISYLKKYFFNSIKKTVISSSKKKKSENIKDSSKKHYNTNISNISKDLNINNYTENNNDNSNDYKIKIIRIKKEKYKSNLFHHESAKKENIEDKNNSKDEINMDLNKSDLYEKSEFSEDISENEKMNYSAIYDFPKKRLFRVKIRKCKIIRRIIESKTKKKSIKEIQKEDEEMRKKNKITYLLSDKFSYNNNCLRMIKNYFNIWRKKNNEYKSDIIFNENEYNLEGEDSAKKDIKQNLKYKLLKGLNNEKNENTEGNECEDNEKNILDNKNMFYLPLNCFCAINNKNRIEINSLLESEENNSICMDKNELEDKIEYFRNYLINVYLCKRKKNVNFDERKDI